MGWDNLGRQLMRRADVNLAVQTYTVREFLRTRAEIAASMKKLSKMGYRAVELAGLGPISAPDMKKILDGEGLACCGAHESFANLRDKTQEVVEKHRVLDCEYVATGIMPEECRNGDGFRRFAGEASEVAARLAKGGLTYCYHNHSFEFEKFGDRTGFETLFSESSPTLFNAEVDVYWVQHGGGDPARWIAWLGKRARLVHLKDMTMHGWEQRFAEVGEGNLNWPSILKACKTVKPAWYVVEQDSCARDPFESLAISLKNIRSWKADGASGIRP
jgi:sugar phosphate isomerase/epimerase